MKVWKFYTPPRLRWFDARRLVPFRCPAADRRQARANPTWGEDRVTVAGVEIQSRIEAVESSR